MQSLHPFPLTYSIHVFYDCALCVILPPQFSLSSIFLPFLLPICRIFPRPACYGSFLHLLHNLLDLFLFSFSIFLSRFSIYVPTQRLLSGFRFRRMCLASLKIAWDGKGKSSHVQCYSPDSFKHGFLNLFTIISFHNASLPRLCTHMHVPYSFFSLVLSLSSLVYIPPLAFLHGWVDRFGSCFFSCWVFSRECNSYRLAYLAVAYISSCRPKYCPAQVRDRKHSGSQGPREDRLLLVNLKWNGWDGMRIGFVIDAGGQAAVENRRQNVTTGLWDLT